MTILTIGKKLIPVEQIAYVEAFDPAANPEFKPEKEFRTRLVLLNRDVVLTEDALKEFASANGLHLLADDNAAVSPSLAFRVEVFEPTEKFKPEKAYRTRIKWRDSNGGEQSKLLVMEPETVVNELSQRGATRVANPKSSPRRPERKKRAPRNIEPARTS